MCLRGEGEVDLVGRAERAREGVRVKRSGRRELTSCCRKREGQR